VAPTNTAVYPAKTTDTTQAIQSPSTATKTSFVPRTGTVPATNTQMPSNMGTYPVKPKEQPPAATQPTNDTLPPAVEPEPETPPTSDWLPPTTPLNDNPPDIEPNASAGEPTPEPAQAPKAGGRKQDGVFKQLSNWYKAKKAGSTAGAVRNNSIQYQLEKWMGAAQGLDPDDVEQYRDTMARWAKNNLPQADAQVVQQSISTVDPNKESTITRAIGDIYNSYMRNRAIDPHAVEKAKQISDFEKELTKSRLQKALTVDPAERGNLLSKDAASALSDPNVFGPKTTATPRPRLTPRMRDLMTQLRTPAPTAVEVPQGTELDLDQLKAQRAATQAQDQEPTGFANRGIAGLGNAEPAATAPTTRVTTGGHTPDERARLEKRIQQLQQRQAQTAPVAESRVDFGAMLFDRMKAGK